MAVIETTRRGGSIEQTSFNIGATQTLVERKRRSFRVSNVDTDKAAREAVVAEYGDIDSTHPDNPDLLLRRISPEAVDGTSDVFDVQYEYEFRGVPGALPPVSEPPNIVWTGQLIQEPTYFDVYDQQIVNTAGEAFDQTIVRTQPVAVLQYTVNQTAFSANIILSHLDCVNDGTWTTQTCGQIPDYCAKVVGITATRQWQGVTPYFRVTYEIAFRNQRDKNGAQKGWKLRMLNVGFSYIGSDNKLTNMKVKGEPPRTPCLLSADGTRYFGDGRGPLGAVDPDNPHFLEFDTNYFADFSLLQII